MDTSPFDIFPLDPYTSDPHAENAQLRQRGPLVRVTMPGGVPAWAVTRHATLQTLLTHPAVSKETRHWHVWEDGGLPEGWPMTAFVTIQGMTTSDGADHRRLRGLVSQAFTPRRVAALHPRITALTAGLLDRMAELPPGPVDLREVFAYPLPLAVICELLGLPEQTRHRLHVLAHDLLRVTDDPPGPAARMATLRQLFGDVIELRRREPGDDLTTGLIAARDEDGSRLTDDELFGTMLLMFIAGHETTLNLLTNAVRALFAHPEQRAAVTGGALPWSAVVEETLRWDAPVAQFPLRYATADIELDGVTIRKGDGILASYAAAGRDPAEYGEHADRFTPTDPPARHLSLGHGIHYCLGAPLARMEAETALGALFTRFPALAPAVPLDTLTPSPTIVSNSTETLPVLLGPAAEG
ncbi:cytochrome P450 family protein [Streptantibioticus silvisoli]|uniref:Cytochrome P450 n=1 Tax=Streptantibioticus silvisoli TaxID=2705255 RepID=A0ABT6WAD2_9ACTN|nr:cytochrome P450 [Streptantibioticus silvisoli]MDI5966876.1 cytochrome P450 [Streptantibioticus silvisoli]